MWHLLLICKEQGQGGTWQETHSLLCLPEFSQRAFSVQVSLLSYGAWVSFGYQVQVPEAKELLSKAYEAGVNFFDNAET